MDSKKPETNWYLYLTAATVNLTTITVASMLAWTSPSLEKIKEENPLGKPLTTSESALISSLLPIGAVFGSLISPPLSDRYGRKRTLLLASSLSYVSYLLIAFASEVWQIYIARIVGGFVCGADFTIIPTYIAEISQKHNRGLLSTFFSVAVAFGKLCIYAIGPFVTIQQTCYAFLVPATMFILIFSFIPESPYWLSSKGKESEAHTALATFRRKPINEVSEEMSEIKAFVKESFEVKGGFLDIYRNKTLFRMLLLIAALMLFQQFTGANVILFYMQSIFESAGSSVSPEIAVIIVGVAQFLSIFLPTFLIDKAGRRILLIISMVLECASMVAIGIYFFLRDENISTDAIFWLPILSLIVFIIGYGMGIGPVAFVILGELFPPHVKAVASAVGMAMFYGCIAVTTTIFPYMVEAIGQGETFWCFGGCSFVGIFFIYFFVPETKGKTLYEINHSVVKSLN